MCAWHKNNMNSLQELAQNKTVAIVGRAEYLSKLVNQNDNITVDQELINYFEHIQEVRYVSARHRHAEKQLKADV